VTEISVEIQKKNPILPYKWLFWWVFKFRFLREDVKSTLISVTAEKWSYTSYLFFIPVKQIIVL
jgi:hypothetical protein